MTMLSGVSASSLVGHLAIELGTELFVLRIDYELHA